MTQKNVSWVTALLLILLWAADISHAMSQPTDTPKHGKRHAYESDDAYIPSDEEEKVGRPTRKRSKQKDNRPHFEKFQTFIQLMTPTNRAEILRHTIDTLHRPSPQVDDRSFAGVTMTARQFTTFAITWLHFVLTQPPENSPHYWAAFSARHFADLKILEFTVFRSRFIIAFFRKIQGIWKQKYGWDIIRNLKGQKMLSYWGRVLCQDNTDITALFRDRLKTTHRWADPDIDFALAPIFEEDATALPVNISPAEKKALRQQIRRRQARAARLLPPPEVLASPEAVVMPPVIPSSVSALLISPPPPRPNNLAQRSVTDSSLMPAPTLPAHPMASPAISIYDPSYAAPAHSMPPNPAGPMVTLPQHDRLPLLGPLPDSERILNLGSDLPSPGSPGNLLSNNTWDLI